MDLLKFCETCSEEHLFCCIYSLGGIVWQVNHDLADGRMEDTPEMGTWLIEQQHTIQNLVLKTARFDVAHPLNENDSATSEYWDWYAKMKTWWFDLSQERQDIIIQEINEKTR